MLLLLKLEIAIRKIRMQYSMRTGATTPYLLMIPFRASK